MHTIKLSGNLYLDGPEDSKTYYAGEEPVNNKIGTLTIFDPLIDHWVYPNKSDTPRVSMAFDTIDIIQKDDWSSHTFIRL